MSDPIRHPVSTRPNKHNKINEPNEPNPAMARAAQAQFNPGAST